jgi:hypothetical protein
MCLPALLNAWIPLPRLCMKRLMLSRQVRSVELIPSDERIETFFVFYRLSIF